jgi:translation initiation factor 2D
MMHCAPPGVNLDIKKSSYKKLSKFLAEQEKAGIMQIKELQKGKFIE